MIVLKILAGILLLFAVYILFLAISVLFVDPNRIYDTYSPYFHKLVQSVFFFLLLFGRVKVDVSGMEKVPSEGRFLLVGNHRSNYDPLITGRVFRDYQLSFLSKEKNLHLPIAGRLIRAIDYMAIDRENARNALVTVNKCIELINKDVTSIGVYPEGTRNKDGIGLLPFHNGIFRIAEKTGVPVVIVSMEGTEKISSNWPLHTTRVTMRICDVIPGSYTAAHKAGEISEQVRISLENALKLSVEESNIKA